MKEIRMMKIELEGEDALDYIRMVNKDVNTMARKTMELSRDTIIALKAEIKELKGETDDDTTVQQSREPK